MDIKLLPTDLPPIFSIETAALGKLFCFQQRVKDWEVLNKNTSKDQDDSAWVRTLISVSCNAESSLINGEFKPEENDLSDEDVARLSEGELEIFAELYIENNSWLRKINNGKARHHKNNGEPNVAYLRRLNALYESNLASSMGGASKAAFESYKQAVSALEGFDKVSMAAKATDVLSASTLAKISTLRQKENDVLKAFNFHSPFVPPSSSVTPYLPSSAVETVVQLKGLSDLIVESNLAPII